MACCKSEDHREARRLSGPQKVTPIVLLEKIMTAALRKMTIRTFFAALLVGTLFFQMSPSLHAEPLGGEVDANYSVEAYDTDRFLVTFNDLEKAVIFVQGDGDTDLDLYVYDSVGNLVASDTDETDTCFVTFTPPIGQPYTIEVRNLGDVYNAYELKCR